MKTVCFNIDLQQMGEICEGLEKYGFYPEYAFEGVLLDSVFYDLGENPGFKIGRYKARRFLMINDYYVNQWSSGLRLTLTDSEKEYINILSRYQPAQDVATA